jgi:hypothetical protein
VEAKSLGATFNEMADRRDPPNVHFLTSKTLVAIEGTFEGTPDKNHQIWSKLVKTHMRVQTA